MRLLTASALLLVAVACSRGANTRCEKVCRVEAECADKLDLADTDSSECVESCSELERNPRMVKLVEAHLRCVNAAASCAEVLECL